MNNKNLSLLVFLMVSLFFWTAGLAFGDEIQPEENSKLMLPEDGYGMIYVMRPMGFWPQYRLYVYIDKTIKENLIGYTVGGQYLAIQVTPGEHIVYSVGGNTKYVKLDVKEGDILFVQQNVLIELIEGSDQDSLERISDIKGKQLLRRFSKGWVYEQ